MATSVFPLNHRKPTRKKTKAKPKTKKASSATGATVYSRLRDGESTVNDLAALLIKISNAAEKILSAGLTEKALVALIQLECPVTIKKSDIKLVLNSLPKLKRLVNKDIST